MEIRAMEEERELCGEPQKNLAPVVDGRELCPQCGRPLTPRKCRLICECGYFMSCSDF